MLFVTPYVPSLIRVRSFHFLRQMSARHRVTLFCTTTPREERNLEALRSLCDRIVAVPTTIVGSVLSCGHALRKRNPLQSGFCRTAVSERTLRSLLEEGGINLVHVEHLRAGWVGDLIPHDMPALYDSVDCISLLLKRTRYNSHSRLQRLIATVEEGACRRYEAHLLGRFRAVTVTAEEDAEALRSLDPGASVTVIPNGVDLDYFHPFPIERDPATIVFSGKMSYHANVTALLHFVTNILPIIKKAQPEVKFRVVGSNPPLIVRALAATPGIAVTGYMPDIRQELARATVAVCPVTVKVGIQNKVLEAMAMGLPVVSTEVGALGLRIQPGIDALVAASPGEFAERTCSLLADRTLQHRLSESGRRYVETYHRWDTAASQLERLYYQTVEASRRVASG